jgi:hypothetical protein
MSELPDAKITTATLRATIRSRISAGLSRRAIILLIQAYAAENAGHGRVQNGVRRLPVELIPNEWRAAFLDALDNLSDDYPDTAACPRVHA